MFPYLITFAITLFVAIINEWLLKKHSDSKGFIFVTASLIVLIPAILAGCRDYSIGTDTMFYVVPFFEQIVHTNVFDAYDIGKEFEIGFSVIGILVSRFTDDAHCFLFVTSAFIGLFTYLALYRMCRYCSIFLGEAVYLFCMYNENLNMVRQCMAMAIILLAMTYMFEKRYLSTLTLLCCSLLFHKTAVIGFGICFLAWFIGDNDVTDQNGWCSVLYKYVTILGGIIIAGVFFETIARTMIEYGILPSKYLYYLDNPEIYPIGVKGYFAYVLGYVFLIVNYSRLHWRHVFLIFALLDGTLFVLRVYNVWFYRIATYFFYCKIFSMSQLFVDIVELKKGYTTIQALWTCGVLCSLLCYWIVFIILGGAHETYPYVSQILGI